MNRFNNNVYPTGGYYNGFMYQEQPKLNMTQGLTAEQLKALRKNPGGFSLDISEEELWRSYCTHRQENKFMVTTDEEGNFICSLCGTKFKPFEGGNAEAKEVVERMVNLLETTKMQSLTLPPQTIQSVFQIEPIINRIPALYEQSCNDYKRATGMNDNYIYGQENNAFASYSNLINPMAGNGYYDPNMMYGSQPVYGQQPMGQPMGQPMYGQQPVGQPMYQGGYPQQPMGQPMYGQQPVAPQGNPFNLNSAPVDAAAAQAPAPANVAPQQESVTVTKTLTD